MDRRGFIAGASAAALCCGGGTASAQRYRLMCSYAGGTTGQGLLPATRRAIVELQSIMRALGYRAPLEIYQGGVPNAAATVIGGRPVVLYNAGFLNGLARCHSAAAVTVLAHEVGHHANLDTQWTAQFKHPWSKELGADFVSGVAMRRMGYSWRDAQSGINCSFGPFSPGNQSHPDSQRRLRAINDGYSAG
ncbi:hypothetical protein HK107_14885 [Parvularcula sp. ZS-1/3]|uniref:Metalloprotease n=1 Tax=Parvularcula mediterranea TaxID=2732508 RepID=A0A7Y3W694_9PROT|nr:hypothetical protein [Parvularcula mediterranea]NNU17615.1 hypothetical protein [Parvularcula mediterranea]